MPDWRWSWTKSALLWEQGKANQIMSQVSTVQKHKPETVLLRKYSQILQNASSSHNLPFWFHSSFLHFFIPKFVFFLGFVGRILLVKNKKISYCNMFFKNYFYFPWYIFICIGIPTLSFSFSLPIFPSHHFHLHFVTVV